MFGFDNFLEQPTKTQETIYFLDYRFAVKDTTQEPPDGRNGQARLCGKGHRAPSGRVPFPAPRGVQQHSSFLNTLVRLFFLETSSHRHG